MRNPFIILLVILLASCEKEPSIFEIKIETSNKNIVDELKQLKFQDLPGLIYRDEKYDIWKSCSGEWGGTIYFRNKQTEKIHYAIATCPISVNKINRKYYVSNSLSHMYGSSDILEIADPEKMEITTKIPAYHPNIITREYEAKSHRGTNKLIDSSGVLIVTSFTYNKKLYSIISNIENTRTTISELKDNRFYTVAELPKKLFNTEPIIIREAENHQKLYFQNSQKGVLEIKDNKIKLTFYEK